MEQVLTEKKKETFTRYQVFIITVIAFIQFTVILDFMVLSPLGAILMPDLGIKTSQFGLVVSAYAFSAGASGLLAAGFADKYDRKKLLLFFYAGFVLGTFLCGIAYTYHFLLFARIVTGIFGGVISSISFAIITDLFALQVRGRVMGFVQMAFAGSQILGIPIGLYIANHLGWHATFLMIVVVSALVGVLIMIYMKPVTEHLKGRLETNPFRHLIKTVSKKIYLRAFAATTLLATGGFMLMPFGSAFTLHNLGISLDKQPLLYGVTGVASMVFGPITGKLSDKIGKYKMFCIGSVISLIMVLVYTSLSVTSLGIVMLVNVLLFIGISSRMISASALMSAIPQPKDRGAFMSVNSSVQQISGGIASAVAGIIVFQSSTGKLEHYNWLGYVVTAAIIITMILLYFIHLYVNKKEHTSV
jgi:predicted MFS family arabinose efflux permease